MIARALLIIVGLASLGCSGDEERAPPPGKSGEPIPNLRSCGELMDAAVSDDQLIAGDAAAGCAADLIECPLADRAELCVDAGTPGALCQSRTWRLVCHQPSDAGL